MLLRKQVTHGYVEHLCQSVECLQVRAVGTAFELLVVPVVETPLGHILLGQLTILPQAPDTKRQATEQARIFTVVSHTHDSLGIRPI